MAGNLPAPLTSFVGRRHELAEIGRLLAVRRLLTLTGVGGVGKTRLAIQAAAAARPANPDGVWLVDLAPVRDPAAVVTTVAGLLQLPDLDAGPALGSLVDRLSGRRALILLDNCEHLTAACAELAKTLLSACPQLRLLVTSRQMLGLTGEQVFAVPSLSVPDEALQLLRERATAVRPDFRLTEAACAPATRLCAALDGLPLAIELAASRLRTLTVEQAADRLDDPFTLLTGGCTTASPRQRSLRGMVDWSYELCTPAEQRLWRRLSVFRGGFDLDAAEEVCSGHGIADHEVLDLVDRLISKSVVLVHDHDGMPRYRLLRTFLEYGRCRLRSSGEERHVLRRHHDFHLGLAERLASRCHLPGRREAPGRLRADADPDPDGATRRTAPATDGNPLSRRETEVAALVAQGMTNRQIASTLGVSPRTADRHIENILVKLVVGRRAQIAAWWSEHGTPTAPMPAP